jgi:hypothetical protein
VNGSRLSGFRTQSESSKQLDRTLPPLWRSYETTESKAIGWRKLRDLGYPAAAMSQM